MFEAISRSWEFTKLSYRTLLENKHLIVFPVLSSIAAVFVSLSFLLPFFSSGELQSAAFELRHTSESSEYTTTLTYSVGFLFYFCNYFAIMFFNTALVASVMDIMEGGAGRIRFGLSFAVRRIHSIFGWALVSALIGVLLKILERNQKTGRFISSLLGSAWTALTFFVVPIIVSDGVGPYKAVKRSMSVMKETWGTALASNFSMGLFSFLMLLPVLFIGLILFGIAGSAVAIAVAGALAILVITISSTADAIFKAYLYAYATGKTLPIGVDSHTMRQAFKRSQS